MFDFDFDIDWKSVAIGAGAVAAVVGAAYGISKLCEDDDDEGSSRGGESSLPKQKTLEEVLSNVDMMNQVINSGMPLELATKITDDFNFNLPKGVGRTTGIMLIFNSNNDEMINAVVNEYNKWKESNEGNSSSTKEDLDLMEEIINSNMPASLIKAAAQKVNIVFTSDNCRKDMIKAMFLSGDVAIEALKLQYEKWKNGEFASEKKEENSKTSESQTEETKEEESK